MRNGFGKDGGNGGNFRSLLDGAASPDTGHQIGNLTSNPESLANATAQIRSRQRALQGAPDRPSGHPAPRHASGQNSQTMSSARPSSFQATSSEANVSALRDQIKRELVQLRGDLSNSISRNMPQNLDGELNALRSELAQMRNMVASGNSSSRDKQMSHLLSSMDALNTRPSVERDDIAAIRAELADLRAISAHTAREDSLRQLTSNYSDLTSRLDQQSAMQPDLLSRLIGQIDATQAAVESLPSTRHLSGVERRIDQMGSSLERVLSDRARVDTSLLSTLEGRLNEINNSLNAVGNNQNDGMMERLESRISQLADLIQADSQHQNAHQTENLMSAIDMLSNRLDEMSRTKPAESHHVDLLAQRLDDMMGRLDGLSQSSSASSPQLGAILDQISALQRKLEEAPAPNNLSALESRLESIGNSIDQFTQQASSAPSVDFSGVQQHMDKLAEQVQALAPQEFRKDLNNVAQNISTLTDKVDTIAENGLSSGLDQSASNRLERQIAELAGHLESSAKIPSDPERLTTLETQIENISSLLANTNEKATEVSKALTSSFDSTHGAVDFTSRFNALEDRITNQQSGMLEAAKEAAREAVSSLPQSTDNSELLHRLVDDLEKLQSNTLQTRDGTRETFDAVHATLEKIVDRLEGLEQSGSKKISTGSGLTAADIVAKVQEKRVLEEAETSHDTPAMVAEAAPLPPRMPEVAPFAVSAAPTLEEFDPAEEELPSVAAPSMESSLPMSDDALEPGATGTDGMDFIAAARRAAKAAADESAAIGPVDDTRSKKTDKKLSRRDRKSEQKAGGKGDVKDKLARLRKPIILTSVAVLLAVAALKAAPMVAGLMNGDDDMMAIAPVEQSVSEEDLAADVAAANTAEDIANAVDADSPQTNTNGPRIVGEPLTSDGSGTETALASQMSSGIEQTAAPVSLPTPPEAIGSPELRQAAANGNPAAQFEIALRFTEGQIVPKDSVEAAKWYAAAANQGLAPAQFRYGNFLEKGLGVEQDYAGAVEWYEKAVSAGNARAMHNLAVLHTEDKAGGQNIPEATNLFRQAANLGVRDSQFNLGIMYGRGLGVDLDLKESYKWFALAAKGGDAEAAAKRDQVANAMLPEDLDQARLSVENWKVEPLNEAANTVNIPAEWSASAPGATAELAAPGTVETTGSVNPDLAVNLQKELLRIGYQIGTADGKIGPRSSSAISDFQSKMGLPVTGQPSAELLRIMTQVTL
jgi:localization factor PodJL